MILEFVVIGKLGEKNTSIPNYLCMRTLNFRGLTHLSPTSISSNEQVEDDWITV
jgi:hypothetical protein